VNQACGMALRPHRALRIDLEVLPRHCTTSVFPLVRARGVPLVKKGRSLRSSFAGLSAILPYALDIHLPFYFSIKQGKGGRVQVRAVSGCFSCFMIAAAKAMQVETPHSPQLDFGNSLYACSGVLIVDIG